MIFIQCYYKISIFLCFFAFFLILSRRDVKTPKNTEKDDMEKQTVCEAPVPGWNTQQMFLGDLFSWDSYFKKLSFVGNIFINSSCYVCPILLSTHTITYLPLATFKTHYNIMAGFLLLEALLMPYEI